MGGIIKYFRFTWDQVLWEMSYPNLMMLSATIPKYKKEKKNSGKARPSTGKKDGFANAFNNFFKK